MIILRPFRASSNFRIMSEVVLSVILGSFKLWASDKDIIWKMNATAGPFVEGENEGRPVLPMMMSLVN